MSLSNWTVYQNDPNAEQVWRWHAYFLKLSERAEIDAGCSECEARNCRRSPVSPHLKGLLNRSARSELSRFASLLHSSFETTLRKAAHSPHNPATGRNTYMSASIWSSLWPAFSSAAWPRFIVRVGDWRFAHGLRLCCHRARLLFAPL